MTLDIPKAPELKKFSTVCVITFLKQYAEYEANVQEYNNGKDAPQQVSLKSFYNCVATDVRESIFKYQLRCTEDDFETKVNMLKAYLESFIV